MPRFRRGVAFYGLQDRALGTPKFELLSLPCGVIRQQRQLVQPSVKLCSRFRHRRSGDGSMTCLAPIRDRFFNEPGLGVMLCKELGLGVEQLRKMSSERIGDLRMQLLTDTAQQAGMRRVLNQRVLEAVNRLGRRAALEDQLGS